MTPKDVKEIVDFLPQLVFYFIPGAIFISIFNFIVNKKQADYKYFIFKSLIVSYVLNEMSNTVYSWLLNVDISNKLQIFTLVLSVILSYLVSILYRSRTYNNLLKFMKIYRNVKTNFWNDVFDYKNGNYLAVYLKDEKLTYYGKMLKHDETHEKCFVMLKDYTVFDDEGNEIARKNDNHDRVILFLDEASRVEIKYDPNAKL